MSSCFGLLPAPDATRNKSEYGLFNQRSASWWCHLIPRLLNVGGMTPPSPMLRCTDQAGRTTILVRHNTHLTSYRNREKISHINFGERPLSSNHTDMQAGYDLRPCSNACFLASYVIGSLDRKPIQPRNPVRPITIYLNLGDLAALELFFSLD
ncbi:hypothetical protein PIB30_052734 [Stylosanthes scabra]|uniref:Uncharacterized protein n=1 Tax=Stylosanthes scabra TaxID=79078 RepID=A0ABU6TI15_9FABA|nr:hypothetical protein [Stylosanthes scabra]